MDFTYDDLMKLGIDDLRKLNEMTIEILNMKKDLVAKENIKKFSVGKKFNVDHEKFKNHVFIIEKINKKNVIGRSKTTGLSYSIPISIVKELETTDAKKNS